MITRIPRSSFSANINNTAQTNEHQTLSELFYKELEDKFSGKELSTSSSLTPPLPFLPPLPDVTFADLSFPMF